MLLELVLSLAVIFFLVQYFHYGSKPSGSPPGTVGLPIVGVLPSRNCTFEEHINKCRKKFGDTFWLRMGSRNVVLLCDHEIISVALNNPLLQGRPPFFSKRLSYDGRSVKGIAMSEGTGWKNARRFAIRRLRDGGMGKSSIESIILREAEALADDFEKHLGENSELPWSINGSIMNVLWKLIADQRFEVNDLELQRLHNSHTSLINQIQRNMFLLFDLMPWMENLVPLFIQNYFGRKKFEEGLEELLNVLRKMVQDHKETIDEAYPRDLIDSYLIEMKKVQNDTESQEDLYSTFCEKDLLYVVWDLFSAGSETTSSTLRWYLLLMAKYPEIQKKVQEELDSVLSSDRTVSFEDKKSLPYLEATINETLRLKPIAPFGLFHRATEETKIDGYLIPKDTLILANFMACHKSPKLWENPNEFYPKHFLNEDNTINHKKQGMIAFSTGRRVCLGENLARVDLFCMLATLMQRFSFSAPEGEALSIEQSPEQPFFTIPKPFRIIIEKR